MYPGQQTGTFPVMWSFSPSAGTGFYLMGYPADGQRDASWNCLAGFCTAQNGFGDLPFYCSESFDGNYLTASNDPVNAAMLGTGYYLRSNGCKMNGGVSGGPVFTDYGNTWYVNGVNNMGAKAGTTGFGADMEWNWLSSRFGSFFCSVLASQCQS